MSLIIPSFVNSVLRDSMRDPLEDMFSVVRYPEYGLQRDMRDAFGTLNRLGRVANRMSRELANVQDSKDRFQVNLDCSHFKPEEINVKVVDNSLVVDAKHEERSDEHGYISRQFTRRYVLPDNIEMEKMQSKLGVDGVLSICAPKKVEHQIEANERRIPITLTGNVHSGDQVHNTTSDQPKELKN